MAVPFLLGNLGRFGRHAAIYMRDYCCCSFSPRLSPQKEQLELVKIQLKWDDSNETKDCGLWKTGIKGRLQDGPWVELYNSRIPPSRICSGSPVQHTKVPLIS